MGRRRTGLVVVGLLAAALAGAPAAHALSAPQVFLKEVDESNIQIGNWVPLGTPMRSVNRYEVGVQIQDTGQPGNTQRALVQVTAEPDGQPQAQPDIYTLCLRVSGTAGQVADTTEDIRYAGDGSYSVTVTVTDNLPGDEVHGCTTGPATTGSFTATADSSVRFVGHPIITDPSKVPRFSGIEVTPSLGAGETQIRCARDARPAPDGSLTGSIIVDQDGTGAQESPSRISTHELFQKTGVYECVARSASAGLERGPWSAPTPPTVVQDGFFIVHGGLRLVDAGGPFYKLTERFVPPEAAGGVVTYSIRRLKGPATARATVIRTRLSRAAVATLRFRLPPVGEFAPEAEYAVSWSFGGTRFAAARPTFSDFGLDEFPAVRGKSAVQFSAPCDPRRC
jgi:hypothetical protein